MTTRHMAAHHGSYLGLPAGPERASVTEWVAGIVGGHFMMACLALLKRTALNASDIKTLLQASVGGGKVDLDPNTLSRQIRRQLQQFMGFVMFYFTTCDVGFALL